MKQHDVDKHKVLVDYTFARKESNDTSLDKNLFSPEEISMANILRKGIANNLGLAGEGSPNKPPFGGEHELLESLNNPIADGEARLILDKALAKVPQLQASRKKSINKNAPRRNRSTFAIWSSLATAASLLIFSSVYFSIQKNHQNLSMPYLSASPSPTYNRVILKTMNLMLNTNQYHLRDNTVQSSMEWEKLGFLTYFLEKQNPPYNVKMAVQIDKKITELFRHSDTAYGLPAVTRTRMQTTLANNKKILLSEILEESQKLKSEILKKSATGYRIAHLYALIQSGENLQTATDKSGITKENLDLLSQQKKLSKTEVIQNIEKIFLQ